MAKSMKRRIIIREYDFIKIMKQTLASMYYIKGRLYDRVEFEPLTRDMLEKESLIYALKNPTKKNVFLPAESANHFVWNVNAYLYDRRYVNWNNWYGDDGYIYTQSRKCNPASVLGWGTFEKNS